MGSLAKAVVLIPAIRTEKGLGGFIPRGTPLPGSGGFCIVFKEHSHELGPPYFGVYQSIKLIVAELLYIIPITQSSVL